MGEFWLSGLMMKSTSPSSSSAGALSLGVRNSTDRPGASWCIRRTLQQQHVDGIIRGHHRKPPVGCQRIEFRPCRNGASMPQQYIGERLHRLSASGVSSILRPTGTINGSPKYSRSRAQDPAHRRLRDMHAFARAGDVFLGQQRRQRGEQIQIELVIAHGGDCTPTRQR